MGKDLIITRLFETPRERVWIAWTGPEVFKNSIADEKGNVVGASYYGIQGFPSESEVIITFEEFERGDKTKMTLNYPSTSGIEEEMLNNLQQGWYQSFDKLENILKQQGGIL